MKSKGKKNYFPPICNCIEITSELLATSPETLTRGDTDANITTGNTYNWGEVKANPVSWDE